ncbi:MAG: recombinase family protein, partial [Bacteroidales bacterium]
DEGITGTKKGERTALLQLMTDCENHQIDMVITKSLSRFSRNTTDCLELVRRLLAVNVPIFFEKENLNTGSMESELMLAILSSMAEGESTSTSENTKWAVQKRFQNGTFKISYPPYGYEWDREEMKVNPEQAEVVKQIFFSFSFWHWY